MTRNGVNTIVRLLIDLLARHATLAPDANYCCLCGLCYHSAELDFAALAAQPNVSVMRPQGRRIGAQLPDQPAQWARD